MALFDKATPKEIAAFTKLPTRNLEPRQFRGMVRNIVTLGSQATPEEHEAGRLWYPKAHDLANEISAGHTERGAGAIAALSPSQRWDINTHMAREIGGLSGKHVEALKAGDRSPLAGMALNRQSTSFVLRAHQIFHGEVEPHEALPMGMKTGHFYQNILDPTNKYPVTVDTHAHDIAMGRKYPYKKDPKIPNMNRGLDTQSRYDHFADAYRMASGHFDELPNVTQARTWSTWHRLHP
jgi:hypothetical protein